MLNFIPFFQTIDRFIRNYINHYGLAMVLLILSFIIILVIYLQYRNYLQSLKGSPFFLFSGYKTNLKFPFWSSMAVFFGLVLVLISKLKTNDESGLAIFALGPWMPVLALLNFFIQYIIALLVRFLDIDSWKRCANFLATAMVVILVPFSGYYIIFKYPASDINGWGEEAARLSKPEVCGAVAWGLPKTAAGLRQSQCLDFAAHVSGEIKFCQEIYESSRQEVCLNDMNMIAQVSRELCPDGPSHNLSCVNKYCDMRKSPHAFLAECFFRHGKETNDENWCARISGEKNAESKNKCFNTVFLARAEKSLDASWCGRMTGKNIYGQDQVTCLGLVDRDTKIYQALISNNEGGCKDLADADSAAFCRSRLFDMRAARKYYDKAKQTAEIKQCDYLQWYENINTKWLDKWGFSTASCKAEVKALISSRIN